MGQKGSKIVNNLDKVYETPPKNHRINTNFNFVQNSCDSVDKLRNKLPSLEKEIQDPVKYKEFYQFTFNYAKNPGQKGLDLDMALAYWNIVLKGKFRFLDIWTKFLKVNDFRFLLLLKGQKMSNFFVQKFLIIQKNFQLKCNSRLKRS